MGTYFDTDGYVRENAHVHLCSFHLLYLALQNLLRALELFGRQPHAGTFYSEAIFTISNGGSLGRAANRYRNNTLMSFDECYTTRCELMAVTSLCRLSQSLR